MWHRLRHRHPAQIALIAPIAIITLIGVLGLVVDIGVFRVIDSELENAADAAALAAAWYDPVCPDDPTANPPQVDPRCDRPDNGPDMARSVAAQYAKDNWGLAAALCGSDPVIPANGVLVHAILSPRANGVTVIIQCRAGYLAGRVLGLGSTAITRWGTAAIGDEQDVIDGDGTTRKTMGRYVNSGSLSPPLITALIPQ